MAWALKGALQGPPGTAGESVTVVDYLFSTSTGTPPGDGQMRLDNSNQTLATKIWLDDDQATGVNTANLMLRLLQTGMNVYVQDKDDGTRWQQYVMTADAIDQGAYVELPVAWAAGGVALTTQRVAVAFLFQGLRTIQDEGAALARRDTLNFTGAGVTATDDAANNRTNVTIPEAVAATNAQTGTSYTLQASDHNKIVTLSNAAAITLTVPAGLGAGFSCLLIQLGAGKVTVTASGVTVQQRQSFTKTAGQYAVASLLAHAANTFVLSGDLGT